MTATITRTQRRFVLPEAELPTHYVNIAADLPEPLPPPLHPGTREPIGPEMLAPLFPMELIRQEVSAEPLIEIPEEVREAYRIYRPTPLHPGTAPGEGARHPGAHLLQERGRLARPAATSRTRRSRRPSTTGPRASRRLVDRDRRRPVGERPRLRRGLFGHRDEGLHGQDQLRAEAVSAQLHRDRSGRPSSPSPSTETNAGRADPGRGPGLDRQPRDRDQRGDRGGGRPRGHEVLARQRRSTTCSCTRRSSARRRSRRWRWPASMPDVVIGCAGGGSNFSGHRVPVPARTPAGPIRRRASWRSSRRRARA